MLIGVLDTGIWPEHPSFSDPDPSGKAYAPPSGGPYPCDFGNTAWNPNDAPFTCNNKLIGAYEFLDTYKVAVGLLPEEFDSARDYEGHGTHTSSTAAGNAGVDASIFGVDRGTISGIAPRAQVIMYRVCADEGCYSSDSAAAAEQAILDGVNVINFSISGGSNPFSDVVSQAFLDAYNAGVFVAASAGNAGPGADTTDHREPWVATVAASTGPRAFQTTATISGGGTSLELTGTSLTAAGGPAPVYVSATDPLCLDPYAPGSVTGMIVVCERGNNGRIEKGYNVSVGRRSWYDPVQPERSGNRRRIRQPLPACCADPVLAGSGAAGVPGSQPRCNGLLAGWRSSPRPGRRYGFLQLARRPRADFGRQQARYHRPRRADPGGHDPRSARAACDGRQWPCW